MRIQFNVSTDEYNFLSEKARQQGFPNVAEMCKTYALEKHERSNSMNDLYREMTSSIAEYPEEKPFFLRDIIDTPPALLGRWLYEGVEDGRIPNVTCLGKQGADGMMYVKTPSK